MEKSSFEKIRRLLEISEREHHCRVLLTTENISVIRHNPAPYTLSVIPRPLPSHVVEGEHFVVVDLWCLVSGGANSSRNPIIEASSHVHGARSTSRSSSSSSGGSSSSLPALGERTRSKHPERLLLPAQVAGPAPRVVKVKRKRAFGRRNASGSKGEDFVPWIPADTEGPQDLEEEERLERMTGCSIAMPPARGSGRWFPAVSLILPRLWDLVCLALREDRRCKPLSFLVLLSLG